jgi:hypothetical protein
MTVQMYWRHLSEVDLCNDIETLERANKAFYKEETALSNDTTDRARPLRRQSI